MASGSRRFCVVQLEFPWQLGPPPGRYTIRERLGEEPDHVLVLSELSAPERPPSRRRQRRMRRRAVTAPPDGAPSPSPPTIARATLVDTAALPDLAAAERWLAGVDLDALAAAALARLNRVLHAERIASANPYAREVVREQALAIRIAFGDGDRVAEGRWERARELPPSPLGRRRPRTAALRPQERLAALLGGRDAALACEELALRARLDVDAGRAREAALQLRAAHAAALAELEPWRNAPGLAARLDELRERGAAVRAVADAALQAGLDDAQIELVDTVLRRLEAALRARTAGRER